MSKNKWCCLIKLVMPTWKASTHRVLLDGVQILPFAANARPVATFRMTVVKGRGRVVANKIFGYKKEMAVTISFLPCCIF